MAIHKVGIVGSGGIGMAYAAWISERGHDVTIWSPRSSAEELRQEDLVSSGVLETRVTVRVAKDAADLAGKADVILIAVPANGHQLVMDALLPSLRSGQTVIVSAMSSLSSLYLFEQARRRNIGLTVASFGTTALTARRVSPTTVKVMTRRNVVHVSCLPGSAQGDCLSMCSELFGSTFGEEGSPLVTTLSNTSAIGHVPLALLNWTRIERAEAWPQYHYMTASVASLMEELDRERIAVARAFGITVRSVEQHFQQSFGIEEDNIAGIAAELHRRRGGPSGPTDLGTRYLSEDVPFGLVFTANLGRIAGVFTPVTDACIAMASLVLGEELTSSNHLVEALELRRETVVGLLKRMVPT